MDVACRYAPLNHVLRTHFLPRCVTTGDGETDTDLLSSSVRSPRRSFLFLRLILQLYGTYGTPRANGDPQRWADKRDSKRKYNPVSGVQVSTFRDTGTQGRIKRMWYGWTLELRFPTNMLGFASTINCSTGTYPACSVHREILHSYLHMQGAP